LRHRPPRDFRIVILRDEHCHRRVDHTRARRIDADALSGIVKSGAPNRTVDRVLARGISAASLGTLSADNRRAVDAQLCQPRGDRQFDTPELTLAHLTNLVDDVGEAKPVRHIVPSGQAVVLSSTPPAAVI
jgi:hypothetical protein